jgi:hypothetical protein
LPENQRNIIRDALRYYAEGMSVIPCGEDKKPLIPWSKYRKRRPGADLIKKWLEEDFPGANIGIVTGWVSGVVVIDIDDMDAGEDALKDILRGIECPTCQTPRGGQHLYFKCPDPPPSNNIRVIPGCDFRGEGGFVVAPPSFGASGEYIWLPGLSLWEVPLPDLPEGYLMETKIKVPPKSNAEATGIPVLTKGRRNADIFSISYNLMAGGMLPDRALDVVLHMASTANPPYSEEEARRTFASARERAAKGAPEDRNVSEEIDRLLEGPYAEGTFRLTWVTETLRDLTPYAKGTKPYAALRNSVEQKIHRLKRDGVIEPSGRMAGEYRRVNKDLVEIDFKGAPTDKVELNWPFELERLVHTYPKNLVVVSGESDAGKTAFLLNFVEMNMERHRINYFSSEAGPTEMRSRLENFDRPLDTWTFFPSERAGDFADVIRPNEVNVIDFLDVVEDFFLVGKFMKQIFDKLDKGVCVIAIQKNKGTDLGVGGARSIEKARLYVSMSRNTDGTSRLKIIKGKNWVDPRRNPNGRYKDYNLVGGCKFVIKDQEWRRDY